MIQGPTLIKLHLSMSNMVMDFVITTTQILVFCKSTSVTEEVCIDYNEYSKTVPDVVLMKQKIITMPVPDMHALCKVCCYLKKNVHIWMSVLLSGIFSGDDTNS